MVKDSMLCGRSRVKETRSFFHSPFRGAIALGKVGLHATTNTSHFYVLERRGPVGSGSI